MMSLSLIAHSPAALQRIASAHALPASGGRPSERRAAFAVAVVAIVSALLMAALGA